MFTKGELVHLRTALNIKYIKYINGDLCDTERMTCIERMTMRMTCIEDAFYIMRFFASDLNSAVAFICSSLRRIDQSDIENGSCQNIKERRIAQLVAYYDVSPNAFYEFDT